MFERIDNNGDGYIDVEEFGIFLRSIGLNPTDEEVLDLFCKMDKDGSSMIEFDEFINILDHPMIKLTKNDIKFSIESSFRWTELFILIHLESKNFRKFFPTNDIRVTDLKDILTKMGKMRLTEEEFEDLITKVTSKTSESGIIDYRQIVELFVKDYEKVNIINNDNDDDSDSDPASDDEVDHLEMPSNKY